MANRKRIPASVKFYNFIMSPPNEDIMNGEIIINNQLEDDMSPYRPRDIANFLDVNRTNNISQYMKRYSEVYPEYFRIEGATSDRIWLINHKEAQKNNVKKASIIMSRYFNQETMKLEKPPRPKINIEPKPMYLRSHKFQFWGLLSDLEFVVNSKNKKNKKTLTLKARLVRNILSKKMELPLNYQPTEDDQTKHDEKTFYKDLYSKKETRLFSVTMPFWFYWKLQKHCDELEMSVAKFVRDSIIDYKKKSNKGKKKNG